MAFHTACSITCRRICHCELGFPEGLKGERSRRGFLEEVARVEEFLRDPWLLRDGRGDTVQVPVPRVQLAIAVAPGEVTPSVAAAVMAEDCGDEAVGALSAQAKRSALQRQAAAASLVAEEYVRRMEAGMDSGIPGEEAIHLAREDQSSSAVKIICRICFSGENEGSKRAIKMLSCKFCNKKYHRSCLKIWAEYRDLFHWSSWVCPSCRICEVCRRAGDPTKLMYCKRCDAAYHCYCQQPLHKNVSHGPYLCPKHTRCHSCGSTVSGSGHSTRWFLSYTCCDACGRLFVKGKYCPVCLKVYRDSEFTPMVCCDVCQQWVHCVCDNISDEKYQQFQTDKNLSYNCPACRGNCYQVKDMDDAVRELWRRRDKVDRNLIESLRSAAGLPIDEEIFSISLDSDDDEDGTVMMKNDHRRSLKFSLKGSADKTSKSSKVYVKNSPHSLLNKKFAKKGYQMQPGSTSEESYQNNEVQHEAKSLESSFKDQKNAHMKSWRRDGPGILSSPTYKSPGNDKNKPLVDRDETRSNIKEASVNNISKASKVHIKGSKAEGLHIKEGLKNVAKNETSKGTKLVIHFGAKYRNATGSPMSEASSGHKDQDVAAPSVSGDTGQQKDGNNYNLEANGDIRRLAPGGGAKLDNATRTTGSKHEMKEVKLRKLSDMHWEGRANLAIESATQHVSPLPIRKKRTENEEILPRKHSDGSSVHVQSQAHDVSEPFASNSFDDPKPLLKLKFKNPYFEQRSSWAAQGVEENNTVKGQRSKRKKLSIEKSAGNQEDESHAQQSQKKSKDEVMGANWILQKLGKDAIGKRVEVHQPSDNSWHKGVVTDFIEGTDSLSVHVDDGRSTIVELQKQGVRFIAQKQKRAKVWSIKG